MSVLWVQAEGDKRQRAPTTGRHDDESEGLELRSEVIGCASQIEHDAPVAALAEADELVVLADDLAGALGKVERERGLFGAEVVDVEDKFLGQEFRRAPDNPADAG